MYLNAYLDVNPEVAAAIAAGKPVVALESTIISHGMPYPQNVETALKVEQIIRENGAVPATIAIIGGSIGSIIGMYVFRHKTRHWYFVYGLPLILFLQIIGLVALQIAPIEIQFL